MKSLFVMEYLEHNIRLLAVYDSHLASIALHKLTNDDRLIFPNLEKSYLSGLTDSAHLVLVWQLQGGKYNEPSHG